MIAPGTRLNVPVDVIRSAGYGVLDGPPFLSGEVEPPHPDTAPGYVTVRVEGFLFAFPAAHVAAWVPEAIPAGS